jgi:antitoxin component of MazEF toxin-antitoxin module
LYYITLDTGVTVLVVRRSGNSLALALPKDVVRQFGLREGDRVDARLEKIPAIAESFGFLKGKVTAKELHRLSNEGEEVG